jgi:5-methylcytosine-specific restriction endonuclease McrA
VASPSIDPWGYNVQLGCYRCNKQFERPPSKLRARHGLYFCSRACKEETQSTRNGNISPIQPNHYGSAGGKWQYREWALKEYGPTCQRCGYDEIEKMLDVDHIDGNRKNNNLNNLQVLCVWCHALKTRGLVAPNGRASVLQSEGCEFKSRRVHQS